MTGLVSGCIDAIRQHFDVAGTDVKIEGDLRLSSRPPGARTVLHQPARQRAKYLVGDRRGVIRSRGNLDRRYARYEVEDNGRGIAEADRERVFELFRRAGQQDRPGEVSALPTRACSPAASAVT